MSEPMPGDFTVIESRQRIIVHLKADIEVEQAEPKHTDLRRADRMIIDTGIGVLHTFCSGDGEIQRYEPQPLRMMRLSPLEEVVATAAVVALASINEFDGDQGLWATDKVRMEIQRNPDGDGKDYLVMIPALAVGGDGCMDRVAYHLTIFLATSTPLVGPP